MTDDELAKVAYDAIHEDGPAWEVRDLKTKRRYLRVAVAVARAIGYDENPKYNLFKAPPWGIK